MLKKLEENVNSMHEQKGGLSREIETIKKSKMEIWEIKWCDVRDEEFP